MLHSTLKKWLQLFPICPFFFQQQKPHIFTPILYTASSGIAYIEIPAKLTRISTTKATNVSNLTF
jgi:hypothetical protein